MSPNKLRFSPEELCREVFDYWKEKDHSNYWKEYQDRFLIYHTKDYYEKKKQKYFRNEERYNQLYCLRLAKCKNGCMVIYETRTLKPELLKMTKQHHEVIKQGYQYYMREIFEEKKLFIKDNGIIQFKNGKVSRYLGVANYNWVLQDIPFQIVNKLLTIRSNNQWLETHIFTSNTNYVRTVKQDDIRNSNSLQEFINKINPLDITISAKWFREFSLEVIMERICRSVCLYNPESYLKLDTTQLDYNDVILLEDCFNMAFQNNEKFYFNANNLHKAHDKLVLVELENDTNVHLLEVSPFWREFTTEYFPDWELIDEGKRLKKEGLIQRHCVNTYGYDISKGKIAILSKEHKSKKYTMELRLSDSKKVHIGQIRGFANSSAPEELKFSVANILTSFNKEIEIPDQELLSV